jgi:hypothetical protein
VPGPLSVDHDNGPVDWVQAGNSPFCEQQKCNLYLTRNVAHALWPQRSHSAGLTQCNVESLDSALRDISDLEGSLIKRKRRLSLLFSRNYLKSRQE